MSMVINTNISSITAQRHLAQSRLEMEEAMERLSSGLRINSAMDDAAGLTIAHSLDSKITSLNQAVRNANDGVALVQLAEGALDEVSVMLTRMKELATQAANGTYSSADLGNLDKEFQQLSAEITRISENTYFNGINVINADANRVVMGSKDYAAKEKIAFQVGDTSTDVIQASLQRMGSAFIGGATATAAYSAVKDEAPANIASLPHDVADGQKVVFTVSELSAGDQLRIEIDNITFIQEFDTDTDTTVAALLAKIEHADYLGGLGIDTTNSGYVPGTNTLTLEGDGNGAGTANVTSIGALNKYNGNISGQSVSTAANAQSALANIDAAIADVDSYRANLGATANRLEHSSNNLMSRVEHQQSARSRIQDADYAVESANLAKAQVLQQAGTAMLAQANASSQNILSLLK